MFTTALDSSAPTTERLVLVVAAYATSGTTVTSSFIVVHFRLRDGVCCLQHMQCTFQAWEAALARPEACIKDLVKESFMQWESNKGFFSAVRATGFQATPSWMRSQVLAAFPVGQTAVVEEAFHDLRQVETRHQDNCTISSRRKWCTAIARNHLGNANSWLEVDWRKEDLKGNCPKTVPDSVFKPRYSKRATSFDMSEIVSERVCVRERVCQGSDRECV